MHKNLSKRLLRLLRPDCLQTAQQLLDAMAGDRPSIKTVRRQLERMEFDGEGVVSDRRSKPYGWRRAAPMRGLPTDTMTYEQAVLVHCADWRLPPDATPSMQDELAALRSAAARCLQRGHLKPAVMGSW